MKSNKVLDIFEKQLWLYGCRSIQSKKEIHSNGKSGSHCFCEIKKPNKNFLKLKCDWWCSYFDMTDKYCTLSMYITPKTISRCNQKTNTTPQLYCTLSTWVCKPKTYFPPEPKTDRTQQHNWKKGSSSPCKASVFVSLSVILSVCKG